MPTTTDVLVILYVDTALIVNADTQKQIENCVYLGDNQGDIDPPDITKFNTNLHGNPEIAWLGAVLNMTPGLTDYVLISGITINQDGIGIQIRPKQNGSGDTHVDGFVQGRNVPPGKTMDYTIDFSVYRNGSLYNYHIDPKMTMT